ncbi:hypothetical protein HNP73_002963 [Amaricoccus macauensis]|uniref:Tetratricopeptide repeat-like domain-containing protein n=1 Tax=Amaricoccus macauensis TaxID=57001 RepID=A0A840ST62_9RHOB|nr:hypothetical protein [Amaricoccus macauensis]MBB5223016.1 hypothetical protein [Amaricoccus macauensis]
MHNSDSFIHEVSEEVRRDRLYATLRRYGWILMAIVLLIVGGAAANEIMKLRHSDQAEGAGATLHAAFTETDPATRAGLFGDVAKDAPHAIIARLGEAGALTAAGQPDKAAAVLLALADDNSILPVYRQLASLQRVMLLGKTMDPSERAATLETLSSPDSFFRPLALEQRALMHLDQGDKPAAVEDLNAVITDASATEAMRARARQLVIAAGGTVALLPTLADG